LIISEKILHLIIDNMSITERAKDMGVEELVKENRKLKKENKKLKEKLSKREQ
jgi:regulator of replication initiation timing